jgi:hypothetical protein
MNDYAILTRLDWIAAGLDSLVLLSFLHLVLYAFGWHY